MMPETHDIGYLKRVDNGDGTTSLKDWSGKVVATVQTDLIGPHSNDHDVRLFRVTMRESASPNRP